MSGGAKKLEKQNEFILLRILKCITIEPAVFMISLSMTIENISNSQIVIDKTCNIDYEYNDTVCDSLVTDFKDENSIIQKEVSIQCSSYSSFIDQFLMHPPRLNLVLASKVTL